MARPVIESSTLTTVTANTSHVINMPATRPDNDVYIFLITIDGSATITEPGAWTIIGSEEYGLGLYYRVGSSEPATYTVTTSASTDSHTCVYRIKGTSLKSGIYEGTGRGDDLGSTTATCPSVVSTYNRNSALFITGTDVTASDFDGAVDFSGAHYGFGSLEDDLNIDDDTSDFLWSYSGTTTRAAIGVVMFDPSEVNNKNGTSNTNINSVNGVSSSNIKRTNSINY